MTNDEFLQDHIHRLSLADPESFWSHQASLVHWHTPPSAALRQFTKNLPNGISHPSWTWFPGGEISTCYNCLDRHILGDAAFASRPAILYDSPVTQTKTTITYGELLSEVEILAAVLRQEGVNKGDVVLVYMPMIPAALIALLAINRLGAIHVVVFGGFAPPALAERIDSSRPVAILTASAGIDGAKPPSPYRSLVRGALELASHRPPRTLVWERQTEHARLAAPRIPWAPLDAGAGERDWRGLVAQAKTNGLKAGCVPVHAYEPIFLIHTSGTTGKPKGVVRQSGGHAVGIHFSMGYNYGITGPGDVMLTASDIGWVVGQAYILYGPLMRGATTVLYEGKPVGTPDAGAFWRMVDEYGVKTMFTAPTALRAIDRDDGEGICLGRVGGRGGLKTLRAMFLAGERSEATLVTRYQRFLSEHAAPGAQVIDHWWTTEVGSPVTGRAILPELGLLPSLSLSLSSPLPCPQTARIPPLRAGSAGKPMPGFDVRIVDDDGNEVPRGEPGNVVLALPLAPTAFCGLWDDDERFWASYLKKFGGRWLDTGDGGYVDRHNYVVVTGRNDDVLNVSAHRLSSGSIEQAITEHPHIAEAYVVPVPDALKGQLPFAFIVLADSRASLSLEEIQKIVRSQVGPIATLGGAIVCGRKAIPRTRSGKTLRRVLRDILADEMARAHNDDDGRRDIKVPDTIEDAGAMDEVRKVAREYCASLRAKL